MNSNSQNKLLTPEEVRAMLNLKNVDTLSVWRSTKRYPGLAYVKVGRLVRYRQQDVLDFIESRLIGGRTK